MHPPRFLYFASPEKAIKVPTPYISNGEKSALFIVNFPKSATAVFLFQKHPLISIVLWYNKMRANGDILL